MIVLAIFALLPRTVAQQHLAKANAMLEFGRASAAIIAPSLAAWLIGRGAGFLLFPLAFAGGLMALACSRFVTADLPRASSAISLWRSVGEGTAFVAQEPLLRAIAVCAIFWNSAFFALTAVFVPYAARHVDLSIAEIG